MGELKSSRYDSTIAEKANTPFAKHFRELVPDAKTANELKDYLGITIQAINQYKQGTAYPKTENLIKIADYFGISVDFLLGITDIPNTDTNMQAVHKFTGLSAGAIGKLQDIYEENRKTAFSDIISLLIENPNAEYLIAVIADLISCTLDGSSEEETNVAISGNGFALMRPPKGKVIKAIFQTYLTDELPNIAAEYKRRFDKTPNQRNEEFLSFFEVLLMRNQRGEITDQEFKDTQKKWMKGGNL